MPFYIEDLTVNDGDLPIDGVTEKQVDIDMGANWAKIRSIKIVQLTHGPMQLLFEIWESATYDPTDRSTFYLRLLRRTIEQAVALNAEFHEILNPELLYKDRDNGRQMHIRIVNLTGGTASDFALVIKCAEVGENL